MTDDAGLRLLGGYLDRSGTDTSWKLRGACRGVDPELFFPARGVPSEQAKEVCRGCEVRDVCLDYALDGAEKWGVWGGVSEKARRRMRRGRGRGVAS